ncbi:MAG TPA: glucuronate isomerase, partial [Acidobacteriota bacterium]|nr:glucuronate isomerase [Acidobacteriota bacterium]
MAFLDENYLLTTGTARRLYEDVRNLPVLDPHNHADAGEIVLNRNWLDIWQVEGATDHYVWELMRRRGVAEEKITGTASPREKWRALAEVFPDFVGNPTYEWVHLDLRRRFGVDQVICAETGDEIWERTARVLTLPEMRPQQVLAAVQVEKLCTTDDPTLHLPFHEAARQEVPSTAVLPTWRPDKLVDPTRSDWRDRVLRLGEGSGEGVSVLAGFERALA